MVQLIQSHLKEMFSIIYTPTEGDAIQNYSSLFRNPSGCFLNIFNQHQIHDSMARCGSPTDIDYIVVTDGEAVCEAPYFQALECELTWYLLQILGIGDQGTYICPRVGFSYANTGVGSILISVAKLVLATLCAGIHPNRTLPVVLDCGTDVGSVSYILRHLFWLVPERWTPRGWVISGSEGSSRPGWSLRPICGQVCRCSSIMFPWRFYSFVSNFFLHEQYMIYQWSGLVIRRNLMTARNQPEETRSTWLSPLGGLAYAIVDDATDFVLIGSVVKILEWVMPREFSTNIALKFHASMTIFKARAVLHWLP